MVGLTVGVVVLSPPRVQITDKSCEAPVLLVIAGGSLLAELPCEVVGVMYATTLFAAAVNAPIVAENCSDAVEATISVGILGLTAKASVVSQKKIACVTWLVASLS